MLPKKADSLSHESFYSLSAGILVPRAVKAHKQMPNYATEQCGLRRRSSLKKGSLSIAGRPFLHRKPNHLADTALLHRPPLKTHPLDVNTLSLLTQRPNSRPLHATFPLVLSETAPPYQSKLVPCTLLPPPVAPTTNTSRKVTPRKRYASRISSLPR